MGVVLEMRRPQAEVPERLYGRCGTIDLPADAGANLAGRLGVSGRPLRIAFFPIVWNVMPAIEAWLEGRIDPRFASAEYTVQALDLAEALGAEILLFDKPGDGPAVFDGPGISVRQVPDIDWSGSFFTQRRDFFAQTRFVRDSANAFGADVTIIAEQVDWFALRGLSGPLVRSLHMNLWQPNRARPSLFDGCRKVDDFYGARRMVHGAVSVSSAGAEQFDWMSGGRLETRIATAQHPESTLPEPAPYPDTPRILFAGRIAENKGVIDLLEAVEQLRAAHPETELVFAGQDEGVLAERFGKLGKPGWVKLAGYLTRDELFMALGKSSVLACPTRSDFIEGQPRVLLEAHMAGRPAIASSICPTLAKDSTLFFEPGDVSGLASELERALFEPETRDRLRRGAYEGRDRYTDRGLGWGTQLYYSMLDAAERSSTA